MGGRPRGISEVNPIARRFPWFEAIDQSSASNREASIYMFKDLRYQRAPVIRDMISRFNRDTVWLATGVLGTVVFAALVLAVEEWRPDATNRGLLSNANPATAGSAVARSSKSDSKMTPGQRSSDDQAFAETSLPEISSAQAKPAGSIPAPIVAFTPEMNRNTDRPPTAPVKGRRTHNLRNTSSVTFGYVDVKRRLIELWHQSLARKEKSRTWTAFSNLNSEARKKAAYTAETNH